MEGKNLLISCCLDANLCFCCGLFFVLNEVTWTTSPLSWWIGVDLICSGLQPVVCWLLSFCDMTFWSIENSGNVLFWGSKLVVIYNVGDLYSILVFFGIHIVIAVIALALADLLLVIDDSHLQNYLHATINSVYGLIIFSCNPSSDWWWIGVAMITTSLSQIFIIFFKRWTSNIYNIPDVNLICIGNGMSLTAGVKGVFFITLFHFVSVWVEESVSNLILTAKAEQISITEEMSSEIAAPDRGAEVKNCWNCFVTPGVEVTLYKCRGCKVARYCGEQCQGENWPQHRESCKRLKKRRRGEGCEVD